LFGYYRFNDIPAGETYLISVSGKRYSFSNNTQIRNIAADALDVNFIADDVVSKGS
jgi:predicted ester cyclase